MSILTRPVALARLPSARRLAECATLFGLSLVIACFGGTQSGNPTPTPACDTGTGGIQPTMGGDHGEPWMPFEQGVDETMTPIFDVHSGFLDFDGPPPGLEDPTTWDVDPSGVHYRRPTENEVTRNRWHKHVLLVAFPPAFVTALRSGTSTAGLLLPLADPPGWPQEDLPILSVDLDLRGSHNYVSFTEKRLLSSGSVRISTSRPTYRYYQQRGIDWGNFPEHVVHAFSSSRGGIVVEGGTVERAFWLDGPYSSAAHITAIDIPPASGRSVFLLHTDHEPPLVFGTAADVAPPLLDPASSIYGQSEPAIVADVPPAAAGNHQCADGYDNDLLDGGDGCDFACMKHPDFAGEEFNVTPMWEYRKTFATFGDAMWCTRHELNWDIALEASGAYAAQFLNWVTPPSGPRVPPLLQVGSACWVFPSLTAAESCHHSASCAPAMNDYPWKGTGNNWGTGEDDIDVNTYLNRVWGAKNLPNASDVWGAVEAWTAMNATTPDRLQPIHMAAVVANDHTASDILGKIAGLSFFATAAWRAGAVIVLGREFLGTDPEEHDFDASKKTLGLRIAHEFGHALGLEHDNATLEGYTGFMSGEGNGTGPFLDPDADSWLEGPTGLLKQYEAWTQHAPSKYAPRPSGFAYRGCTDDASCPPGHTCEDGAFNEKVCQ